MTWFKIDDRSHHNPKVLAAGNEAWGAFCRAGAWSAENLTDGAVPSAVASIIAPKKIWRKLLECELVVEASDGYKIRSFLEYNPSAEEVKANRARLHKVRSEAGRAGGVQSGEIRRSKRSKTEANDQAKPEANHEANAKQKRSPDPDPDPENKKEREGACAPTHARAREGQDSDPVVDANPPSADESGPRRAVRDADATHAASDPSEARKTHPGAIQDPANSNDLAAVAATLPDWAVAQVGTAQMTTGYRGDPKVSWARFVAHIFACREQGQARRIGQAEWLKWLTNESRYERGGQPQRESAHKPETRVLNKPAPKKTPEELAAEAAEREANCAATLEMIAKWDAEAEEERKRREANPLPRKARFM